MKALVEAVRALVGCEHPKERRQTVFVGNKYYVAIACEDGAHCGAVAEYCEQCGAVLSDLVSEEKVEPAELATKIREAFGTEQQRQAGAWGLSGAPPAMPCADPRDLDGVCMRCGFPVANHAPNAVDAISRRILATPWRERTFTATADGTAREMTPDELARARASMTASAAVAVDGALVNVLPDGTRLVTRADGSLDIAASYAATTTPIAVDGAGLVAVIEGLASYQRAPLDRDDDEERVFMAGRARPYDGQAHTMTGARGSFVVHGVTMRDVADAVATVIARAHAADADSSSIDSDAIASDVCLLLERMIGVYPNVPRRATRADFERATRAKKGDT